MVNIKAPMFREQGQSSPGSEELYQMTEINGAGQQGNEGPQALLYFVVGFSRSCHALIPALN